MRTGITITLDDADRRRLEAIVTDRNLPQKHVWRARIMAGWMGRIVAEHNTKPKPFIWTADPDRIIAAVKRGHQTLDSIH